MATLKDLLDSGMSREEINAILSQQFVGTDSSMGSPAPDYTGERFIEQFRKPPSLDARDLGAISTGGGLPPQQQTIADFFKNPQPPQPVQQYDPGYAPAGTVEQAAPNTIRNNSTGRVFQPTDINGQPSKSQPSGPALDYSSPIEIGGYGKGYRLKGDATRAVMGDGRIVDMGRDTGAERARMKEDLGIQKQRAELAQIGAKPVAVYGADGKTPEFVSPKDAIGRKPYTASIAGQGEFTPEALRTIAEQYLAGDRQAAQGYARNASAKMAIANEINKVAAEKGMGGADIAAVMADYQGMTAGSRVLGGRTANIQLAAGEAAQMIPLALEASKNVARAGFLPFGKAQIMFDDQTNDPALREFAAANNALVNTYARAISPAGVPTVHDKEHARQVLSTAHDQKSYEATVLQMQKEMDAALAAPAKVRGVMRDSISGKSQAQTPSTEKVMTMQDVMDTSKKWNKTTDQVMKDARAAGFTIK